MVRSDLCFPVLKALGALSFHTPETDIAQACLRVRSE